MNEKTAPTILDTFTELTQFTRERSSSFRDYAEDVYTTGRESKKYVASVQDSDETKPHKIYDSTQLSFRAEYEISGAERAGPSKSIVYTLGLVAINQISQIPRMLAQYIDPDILTACNAAAPGTLSEMRAVEYVVRNYYGSQVTSATRHIEYALYLDQIPLHETSHPTPGSQLTFRPDATPEDVAFRHILDTSFSPKQYQSDIDSDITMSVRGLLQALQSDQPIPTPHSQLY